MPAAATPTLFKRPESQSVYRALVKAFDALGPYEVEEKKTSVHITRGRAFAGVHPRATGVLLSLVLDAPVAHARVRKCEQLSAHRYHIDVLLERPAEVDPWLTKRIAEAYALRAERA